MIRLSNLNNYMDFEKNQDFYQSIYNQNNYLNYDILSHNQQWNSNSNSSYRNINNIYLNNSSNSYNHKSSPIMPHEERQRLMQPILMNTVFGSNSCPCMARIKCQPCGLIPVLDFGSDTLMDCPCAPKLNCPVCPPLSLIHEIASKKVFINLNRLYKINK